MMRLDPHIRSYAETPPAEVTQWLRPRQRTVARYGWPDEWDGDVELVRGFMQEGGPGLYVLVAPVRGKNGDQYKVLAEGYYPEGVRPAFFEEEMTLQQQADMCSGRLTVVGVLGEYWGRLEHVLSPLYLPGSREAHGEPRFTNLMELKKNNRNARRGLKRRASALYRAQELQDATEADHDREQRPVYEAADDAAGELADIVHWQRTPSSVSPSKND